MNQNQNTQGTAGQAGIAGGAAPVRVEPLMQFFAYEHLPVHLQAISKPFGELANTINSMLPSNPEKATALRKLLEAKDCAVRANLFKS